jgi:hypothetical protein
MAYYYFEEIQASLMFDHFKYIYENIEELRQYKYLSCFCPLDHECHVDVLLRILSESPSKRLKLAVVSKYQIDADLYIKNTPFLTSKYDCYSVTRIRQIDGGRFDKTVILSTSKEINEFLWHANMTLEEYMRLVCKCEIFDYK